MRFPAALAIIAAVLGACVACGTSDPGVDGDCSMRVRLNGTTYDSTVLPDLSRDLVRQPLATGNVLQAKEIDCDGSTVAQVQVQQIQGVDLADAIYVDDGSDGRTPYFNTNLQQAPIAFRASTLPVHCSQAVTFTGRLDTVGAQDYGSGPLTPPFRAQVLASAGTGLPFQQWAAMRIDVEITDQVQGLPDRDSVDAALAGQGTVDISAHCDGNAFVADTFTVSG